MVLTRPSLVVNGLWLDPVWLLMVCDQKMKMKWNESGFRPPLCTYRLNWARRTSWGWWDDWDDTVLQTQDSKFEPWRSEAEHATSRSRRLPTILTFTRGWGRNNFVSFKPPRPGTEPRTLAWKAAVLTTTLGPPPGLWPDPVWLEMVLTRPSLVVNGLWPNPVWLLMVCDQTQSGCWWFMIRSSLVVDDLWPDPVWLLTIYDQTQSGCWWLMTRSSLVVNGLRPDPVWLLIVYDQIQSGC